MDDPVFFVSNNVIGLVTYRLWRTKKDEGAKKQSAVLLGVSVLAGLVFVLQMVNLVLPGEVK